MIALPDLAPVRPPCSHAESAAAEGLADSFRRRGLATRIEMLRAPTSPTWIPLIRALVRVWSVACVAAYRPLPAVILASIAVVGGVPSIAALIRFVPILGDVTQNVVAHVAGRDSSARALVVVAHLDTHPTAESPMGRMHAVGGALLGYLALATAIFGHPGLSEWRLSIAAVAGEAIGTIAWLARREVMANQTMPDDNTSGLLALVSVATATTDSRPVRDVWLVASGAGTSGGHGMASFLREHTDNQGAWVVEIDALGSGEVVASPFPARFPRPGTPAALVRAVVAAAHETGDPLRVLRVRRAHSDATSALRLRTAAITLTAGLKPPADRRGPDPANAERAARVVDRLARSAA